MRDMSQQPAEFPIKVRHGNFTSGKIGKGKGYFRMTRSPDGRPHARFEIETDVGMQTIPVEEISRLESSSGKGGLTLRRWRYVGASIALFLIAPLPAIFEANVLSDVAATTLFVGVTLFAGGALLATLPLLEDRVRFICETKTGHYFCGEMLALGYRVAKVLIATAN